jgi:hypothetical protein
MGRVRTPCIPTGNHRGGQQQSPRQGAPSRQGPSGEYPLGHRSSQRVHAALRAIPALPDQWLISGLVYDVATGLVEVVVPAAPIRTAQDSLTAAVA